MTLLVQNVAVEHRGVVLEGIMTKIPLLGTVNVVIVLPAGVVQMLRKVLG